MPVSTTPNTSAPTLHWFPTSLRIQPKGPMSCGLLVSLNSLPILPSSAHSSPATEPPRSLGSSPVARSPHSNLPPLHHSSAPSKWMLGAPSRPRARGYQLSSVNGRHQQEVRGQKKEKFRVGTMGPSPRGRGWNPPHCSPAKWSLLPSSGNTPRLPRAGPA